MVYGYIRVSTDKQTVENQRFEITKFCKKEKIKIHEWVEETISGTIEITERELGILLDRLKKNDVLICSELSRLGRSLFMIMDVLNRCMKKEINVWTIKDNYRLGTDISSKVLAFAFGLSAEIERNLISQRTKEALARAISEGKHIGRPKGSKNKTLKLTGKEKIIRKSLKNGLSKMKIAKMLGVHRFTLYRFCRNLKET
jgi:DNA invertase Pin-like site-specific DNA recombinase